MAVRLWRIRFESGRIEAVANMQAMLLYQPGAVEDEPLRLEAVEDPAPGRGQLLVRVTACGVCRTDLHIVEGELPQLKRPVIPGHQVVGVVDRLGEGARVYGVGERVGVAWLGRTCGTCPFCRRGDENLCRQAHFTGYDADGGYAEFVVIDEDFAYRLPDQMDDTSVAPLLCAGIIGYRALKMSKVESQGRLGLYGFGGSAHITIQIAVHLGMKVFVFSRSDSHRKLARELGAAWCGRTEEGPPEKLDGSIVFAPAGGVVRYALEHLDRGGTCALAGIYLSEIPPLDYDKHLYYERRLCSVTASTRRDGTEFLSLAAAVPVRTKVTTFPLSEANKALRRLKVGQIDGAAVLTIP